MKIFYPLSKLLVKSTSFIDKRIVRKGHDISISELSDAIEITADESTPEEETKMLKGIVRFGDIEVSEIMKSRVDVTAVDVEIGFTELIEIIRESGYSRIPAFENNFDNVKGILYIKDLLAHLDKGNNYNWKFLLREAFFVPENKRINDLLHEFQEKKIHLAIVVDEYGGTSGIVTLEDIIEEIVGEISDEFDKDDDEINFTKLDENNYLFDGRISLNDFYKILEIDDDIFEEVRGESDTLAGLILELEGSIPDRGDIINYQNFSFKIRSVDNRRIKQIDVNIKIL
jgi:gliding motility-associated protein GldE